METVDAGDVPIENVIEALLRRDTLKALLGDHSVACFVLAREALMPEFFRHLIENIHTIDGTLREHIAFVVFHGNATSLIRPSASYQFYKYRPMGLSVSDKREVRLSRSAAPQFDDEITNAIRMNPRDNVGRSVAHATELAVNTLMQAFDVAEADLPCLVFTDHGNHASPLLVKLSVENPIRALYTDVLAPVSDALRQIEPLWRATAEVARQYPSYHEAVETIAGATTAVEELSSVLDTVRTDIEMLQADTTGRRDIIELLAQERAGLRSTQRTYRQAKSLGERLALVKADKVEALGIAGCLKALIEFEKNFGRVKPGSAEHDRWRKAVEKETSKIFSLVGKAMLDERGRLKAIQREFARLGLPLEDLEELERRARNDISNNRLALVTATATRDRLSQTIEPSIAEAERQRDLLRTAGISENIIRAEYHGARLVVEDLWSRGLIGTADFQLRRASKQLKIVLLSANSLDEARLDIEEEARAIGQELLLGRHRDNIRLIACPAVRPDDLLRVLRDERPDVVHFSGHGDPSGIVLRHDREASILARNASLARLLKDRGVRLVVLNSCFSGEQAREISMSVPVVVGTSCELNDEAAHRFSAAFYRTISEGHTVAEAFRDGGDAVDLHNLPDVYHMLGNADFALLDLRRS